MVSGEVVYCVQLSGTSVTKQVDLDLRISAIRLPSHSELPFFVFNQPV